MQMSAEYRDEILEAERAFDSALNRFESARRAHTTVKLSLLKKRREFDADALEDATVAQALQAFQSMVDTTFGVYLETFDRLNTARFTLHMIWEGAYSSNQICYPSPKDNPTPEEAAVDFAHYHLGPETPETVIERLRGENADFFREVFKLAEDASAFSPEDHRYVLTLARVLAPLHGITEVPRFTHRLDPEGLSAP